MKLSLPCLLVTLGLAAFTTPAEAHSRRYYTPPTGTVMIDNHAGVPVTVTVEGNSPRVLAVGECAHFATYEGKASVRATFSQYGTTFSLTNQEVRVRSHRVSSVTLVPPSSGKVKFVNDTGVESAVIVNGRELAELTPGATRIVSVPLGKNEVMMIANGTRVESACLDVRPFSESVIVGEAPSFADLIVSNPLPFAVDVRVDHAGARRVSAYSSASFGHVRVGRVEVESSRVGGYLIDEETVSVRAWSGAQMAVDTPRTGLVQLDSEASEMVRVFVDGRLVSMLEPFADTTLLLPTGSSVIEVRKLDGCLVERSYVMVDALRTASLEFGRRLDDGQHRPERVSERDDRDDRDDHDERDERVSERDDDRHHQPATW